MIPYHDDYTTIWQRVHDMKPEIKLPTYEVEAGSDGTGFKSGNAWDRTYVYVMELCHILLMLDHLIRLPGTTTA